MTTQERQVLIEKMTLQYYINTYIHFNKRSPNPETLEYRYGIFKAIDRGCISFVRYLGEMNDDELVAYVLSGKEQ